jgi:hypothetical protein
MFSKGGSENEYKYNVYTVELNKTFELLIASMNGFGLEADFL